jgi:ABC-2 type transport system permease protein
MIKRILALVRKEFIHLRKDWWLPAFMLLGGALELLLVGWATSRPLTNLPLMVWDQDKTAHSQQVITALENTGTFALDAHVEGMTPIQDALEKSEITAAVIIPPNYTQEITADQGHPTLAVFLNGAESFPAKEALRAIQGVTREIGENVTLEKMGLTPEALAGFDFSLRVWFNETLSEAYYTTPAELGLMLEFTILLFAALSFSRERELGTLEQLLVMPFSSLELMIGKAIPVMIIGFFDFFLMLGMIHFAFSVPVRGSLLLLGFLALGYLFVELSKGMVISVISRSQHQAFLLVLLVGMVDFMFTGYAAPVEGMPPILQYIAQVIPAHHWLTILRGILLKGAGLALLWPNVLTLLVLGIIISTFSWRFVRRKLD